MRISRLTGRFLAARRPFAGTISRKYSCGYLMILLVMAMLFAVSSFCSRYIMRRYEAEIDSLLDLNQLFAHVETVNAHLFDIVTYLRSSSFENYRSSAEQARQCAQAIMGQLGKDWSRDAADLCLMVQSFLGKSGELVQRLENYSHAPGSNPEISALYSETQDIISYINLSFREVYSARLIAAKKMRSGMQRLNRLFTALQVSLLALALFVFLFFYGKVIREVSRSVERPTEFATQVAESPTKQNHIDLKTGDEIEVFASAFNKMLDTIQNQFEQIEKSARMREQLQNMEMENMRISSALQSSQLSLLQARINPHFLFNTLNMISKTAYMEGAEETSRLMESTANYLRYNLGNSTKVVTLGDEIENLQEYVYIQKCRFGERLQFEFETDPSCVQQRMPCMILQPLVENSISHGIGPLIGGGRIIIRAFRNGALNCLEVEDNGVGISPDVLEKIQAAIEESGDEFWSQHTGLQNVYLRLKLFFGGNMEFCVHSEPHRTVVHIGMPQSL